MATELKEKEKKDSGANAAKGFQPLGDRVFVTFTEEMERTAGGIYVPDSAKEKPQRGTVRAIGKEVKNLKVGDQVLFDKYSGSKLRIEDEDCLIIKEEDVLGVFTS
jgi:chaperonin GroES